MNRLMILAAGMASRMKADADITDQTLYHQANARPKGMIGVGPKGEPFLCFLLENAKKAGIEEVLLILNPKDDFTEGYFAENPPVGISLRFARQFIPEDRTKPLGTADAVLQGLQQCQDWKKGTFLVCNADNLYPTEIFEALISSSRPNLLPSFATDALGLPHEKILTFAFLLINETGQLLDIVEKPTDLELTTLNLQAKKPLGVSMNIFKFNAEEIIPFLESEPLHHTRQEKELPSVVRRMATKNAVWTIPVRSEIPDITSKNDLKAIQDLLTKA